MRLRLPNKVAGPPGGWRYVVPETGQRFQANSEAQLIEQLKAHYRANGYTLPGNIADLIEERICAEAQDYCVEGSGLPSVTPSKALAVAFHLVKMGTQRLLGRKDGRVSADEAEARAAICAECPENVPREECSQCTAQVIRDVIVAVAGDRSTSRDEQLKVCRVCLCELKAKVHMSQADILRLSGERELAALPAHCWIKKGEQ